MSVNDRPWAFTNIDIFDGCRAVNSATVVITGSQITAVGTQDDIDTSGMSTIDGCGFFLLPGLIDSHVHAFSNALEESLQYGVTTVLDMFCDPEWVALRRGEQANSLVHKRADIWSAGMAAAARGGHGSEYGLSIPEVGGPENAPRFVADRLAEGSDWIKIIYENPRKGKPVIDRATMTALVEAAHAAGVLAVVHPGATLQAEFALAAGADALAHVCIDAPFSDNGIQLAVHQKATVIPTLAVLERACNPQIGSRIMRVGNSNQRLDHTSATHLDKTFSTRRNPKRYEWAVDSVYRLYSNQVPILAGSDAPNLGISWGAGLHREIELLVAAGITESDALTAATYRPAIAFGLPDRGRIIPGGIADLVTLKENPLKDISAVRTVEAVWKRGIKL
jgi:imidazolonepropionase-like amidohydrolase